MSKGGENIQFAAVEIPREAEVSDVVAARAAFGGLPVRIPFTREIKAIVNVTSALIIGARRGMNCWKTIEPTGHGSRAIYERTSDPREYLKVLLGKIRKRETVTQSDLQPGDCEGCPLVGKKLCPIWFYGFRTPVVQEYAKVNNIRPNEAANIIDGKVKG